MNRFPGFVAGTSLKPSGSAYRGAAGCATSKATVVGARIARQETYGCAINWHFNEVCCRFWQPGGDIVVCCPREGSGPCSMHPGLAAPGLVQNVTAGRSTSLRRGLGGAASR